LSGPWKTWVARAKFESKYVHQINDGVGERRREKYERFK